MKSVQKLTVTKGPVHRDLGKMKGTGVWPHMDPKKPIAVTKGSGVGAKDSTVNITRTGGSTRHLVSGQVSKSKGPGFKSGAY